MWHQTTLLTHAAGKGIHSDAQTHSCDTLTVMVRQHQSVIIILISLTHPGAPGLATTPGGSVICCDARDVWQGTFTESCTIEDGL